MKQREKNGDEQQWVSFLGVPAKRVRPHFGTFSVCFVATLIFYTYIHVFDGDNPSWRQAPSLIMEDTIRAAVFWALACPMVVEGAVMVFGWLYMEEKRQEGREKGREEGRAEGVALGREEANAAWDAWNQRRMEAEANGEPFTEPPPSARNGSSGS